MIIRTNSKRIPAPKRPLAMLMALILALSLCACSYGNAGSPGKESSAAESVAATKPSEDKESSAPEDKESSAPGKADAGNAADNAADPAPKPILPLVLQC